MSAEASASLARLVQVAQAVTATPEPGPLWRLICAIPMERPLPNRSLEEELRLLLTTYAEDLD